MESPTSGQLKVISFIEQNLNISFTGKTKAEAQKWISLNMEKSKEQGQKNRQANEQLIQQIQNQQTRVSFITDAQKREAKMFFESDPPLYVPAMQHETRQEQWIRYENEQILRSLGMHPMDYDIDEFEEDMRNESPY